MTPTPQQASALVHVVREGSFTRAARRLGVSQSAVTQQIGKLEKSLGTRLVLRGPDGVTLTPTGEAFYDLSAQIETLRETLSERARAFAALEGGSLRVIANAPQPALRMIAGAMRALPGLEVEFALHDWTSAVRLMRGRRADLGIITETPEIEGFARHEVARASYGLYSPAARVWDASPMLADLADETLVLLEPGSYTERLVRRSYDAEGRALPRILRVTGFPLMKEAVLGGLGLGIFLSSSSEDDPRLRFDPMPELPEVQTYALVPHERRASRVVDAILDAL
ncbi:MAG: LysR substrate-binding domain-containing protein [Shimia sp.]